MVNNLINMAKAGYFTYVWRLNLSFVLTQKDNAFTLEDLTHVFDSCPKLTHLTIQNSMVRPHVASKKYFRRLTSRLRQGFGRLERMELIFCLDGLFLNSWPIYQKMLT